MGRNVLIVSESEKVTKSLIDLLNKKYDIFFVDNGKDAMKHIEEERNLISAIILAIVDSTGIGWDTLKEIREKEKWRAIPVILITDSGNKKLHEDAIILGADAYLIKPYSSALLLHTLHNVINLREASLKSGSLRRDRLTGLLNREEFFVEAKHCIHNHEAGYYILSCYDVENFKIINDQYGTDKGDQVLKHIAGCIGGFASEVNGLACRFAADRFAILYPADKVDSEEINVQRQNAMSPQCIGRQIQARTGRYHVNDLTIPVSDMYDRATLAQESIKGRFDVHIIDYSDGMREGLLHEQQIVNEMADALCNGEFEPWFQPQYNHATGALIGSEALVRWNHNGAIIPPDEFIPICEKNGFIYEIDQYVWRQVCSYIKRWIDEKKNPLPVSVNISRYDIMCSDFFDVLQNLMDEYDVPVDMLRLEITESAFSESTGAITEAVNELIKQGFTVEIDDFGSGYSSLNTLKDVPASILKLDMKFFENTGNNQRGGNIIESVVRMAKWLGMAVIAEGVEDREQADYLKSIGCYYIQGYYYAKPMPAGQYEKLLDNDKAEHELYRLKTVKNLNNSEFWDPKSMETLIFNSYVGGACIFEYCDGKSELLRANEQYAGELGSLVPPGTDLRNSSIVKFMNRENKEKVIAAIDKAIDEQREASCEVRLSNNSTYEYVRITLRQIAKAVERHLFYCVIVNTTSRRDAERKQAESAQRLEIIMKNINGGVSAIQIDDEGTSNFVFCNERYYELYGYTRAEAIETKLDVMSTIVREDFPGLMAKVKKLKEDKKPVIIDYRSVKKDGKIVFLRANASLMHMEGYGDVITSVVTDITEQKNLDEQLKFLNDCAHNILAQPDSDLAINETLVSLLEYFRGDRAYVIELDYKERVSYNTYEKCADNVSSEMDILQGVPFEVSDYWFEPLRNNNFVVIDDVKSLGNNKEKLKELLIEQNIDSLIIAPLLRDGNLVGYVGVDNPSAGTQQLDRLRALGDYIAILLTRRDSNNQEEERQKELLDNLPCGAALYQYDGKEITAIHINKSYWQLVEREPVDYSDASVLGVIHSEDRPIIKHEIETAIRQNRNAQVDVRILCGRFSYRAFHIEAKISRIADDKYLLFVSYSPISDTEMSVQEMLPIALSTMMSASEDLSYVKDKDLHYICCSKSVSQMLNLPTEKDIIGKTDYDLYDNKLADKFSACDRRIVQFGEFITELSETIIDKKGNARLVTTSKYPLMDTSGNVIGLYGVSRDITSQREKESQLELLTGSIPGGIAAYSITENGVNMLYFNDGFYQFSGYTREEYSELVAADPLTFVFEEDKHEIMDMINNFPKNKIDGHVNGCIFRCHTKDGGYRWMSMRTTLSKLEDNRFVVNAVQLDITEQQEEKERLRVSEELNRIAIEHSGNIITRFDVKTRTLTLPNSFNPIFDVPNILENMPEEQINLGRVSADTASIYRELFEGIIRGEKTGTATYKQNSTKGWRWLEAKYTTVFSDSNAPVSAVISFIDITEELEKEVVYNKWQQSLNERPEESYTLFRCNLSKDASFDSREGKLLNVNFDNKEKSFNERTTEYVEQCVHPEDRKKYYLFLNSDSLLAQYYRGNRSHSMEYREMNGNGEIRWIQLTVDLVEYPSSKDVEAYLMYENIDDEKKAELLTLKRSETDPLTGVYNRATFISKTDKILGEMGIGERHALLMLDIDNFKHINDTLGHGAGDQVLRDLTGKAGAMLRADDLIGRLGGDEFFVFLKNIPSEEAAAKKAEQICALRIKVEGTDVIVTASIGIAMAPDNGKDFDTLYKKADYALYQQKAHGKNGYSIADK